ncbi:MAG: helix-turn-helix domain-containing protein [Clostridiales bacterium]|nr:helix-turn-helix domain-containing protein [Clostridiales bacterium]
MTLKQFIPQEKVEAAKNMLRFSEYPLSEIAHYLGFSSQNYFGAVFLRYTTKTPAQYRRSVQKEKE